MQEAIARDSRAEQQRTAPPRRRTVTITGRPGGVPPTRPLESRHRAGRIVPRTPRVVEIDRRRPPRPTYERLGPRPDRVALWALFMAVLLVLVAATSPHA
jgi:hypothetical protein